MHNTFPICPKILPQQLVRVKGSDMEVGMLVELLRRITCLQSFENRSICLVMSLQYAPLVWAFVETHQSIACQSRIPLFYR